MAKTTETIVELSCSKCGVKYQITEDKRRRREKKGVPNLCPKCMKERQLEIQRNYFKSLSPEKQKEFKNKRNWYSRATAEQKAIHSQRTKDQLAARSKEEQKIINQKNSEGLKKHWATLTNEQRKQRTEPMQIASKRWWDAKTPEERTEWLKEIHKRESAEAREKERIRMIEYNNSLSLEEKQERAKRMQQWHENLSAKEKEDLYRRTHEWYYNLSDEEKENYASVRREYAKSNSRIDRSSTKNNRLHDKFEKAFNELKSERKIIKPEVRTSYLVSHHWDYGIYDKDTNRLEMVVDLDGDYYHGGYNNEYDGLHSNERLDEKRYLSINPDDLIVINIITENDFRYGFDRLSDELNMSTFDQIIDYRFRYLSLYPFPNPDFAEEEMIKSYHKLEKLYEGDKHEDIWHNGIGEKMILHFNESIYWECHNNDISVIDVFNDRDMLRYAISRGIIFNFGDHNKILQGFNVSNIGRRINIISPGVIKMLIMKYLENAKTIIDPLNRYASVFLAASTLDLSITVNNYECQYHNNLMKMVSFISEHIRPVNVISTIEQTLVHDGLYDAVISILPDSDDSFWNRGFDISYPEDMITQCTYLIRSRKYMFITDNPGCYSNNVVMEITNEVSVLNNRYYVILITNSDVLS